MEFLAQYEEDCVDAFEAFEDEEPPDDFVYLHRVGRVLRFDAGAKLEIVRPVLDVDDASRYVGVEEEKQ